MSKDVRCAVRCGAAPVTLKPLPLCALHGLEVAQEFTSGVLQASIFTARQEAAANRSPSRLAAVAAPPGEAEKARAKAERPTQAEARQLADRRLAALRAGGVQRVTASHFRDLPEMTGRSRPWIYMVLRDFVNEGVLVPDYRGEQAGYRFAA